MKKLLLSILLFLPIFALQSCDEKETPAVVTAAIAFPGDAIPAPTLTSEAGAETITFSSTKAWAAGVEAGKTWCTVTPASGVAGESATMTITAAKNETYDSRSAVVTIVSEGVEQAITVTQSQNDSFSFTGAPKDAFPTTGGTFVITTAENTGAPKVGTLPEWITVATAPAAKGLSNTNLTFTVKANTTFDNREAKITITSGTAAPESFVVKQSQVDVLNPVSAATVRADATTGAFSVTHNTNITDLVVASKPDWVTEVTTRAAANKTHNFTATAVTAKEYGRHGVIVFKSATTGETISYTVHQGNIVTNTANATDRAANTLTQTIKTELGLELAAVSHIKVLGTINEADFKTLKTMSHIDLSEATVVGSIFTAYKNNVWVSQLGNAIPQRGLSNNSANNETLKQIILPNNITTIGYGAFLKCTSLSKITLPLSVTTIENEAFYQSTALEQITLNEGLTYIGNSALGECAFTSITIPSTITIIEPAVFQDNRKLISIVIPGTVKEICHNAFQDCSSLVNVTLNEGLTKIGATSFEHTAIESIQLPASLTTMANTIFANSKLKEIISLRPTPPSTKYSFYGLAKIPFITVKAPAESVDEYKAAWAQDVFQEVYHPTTQEITYEAISN